MVVHAHPGRGMEAKQQKAHSRHSGWAGDWKGKLSVDDLWRFAAKEAIETPGRCAQPGMGHRPTRQPLHTFHASRFSTCKRTLLCAAVSDFEVVLVPKHEGQMIIVNLDGYGQKVWLMSPRLWRRTSSSWNPLSRPNGMRRAENMDEV